MTDEKKNMGKTEFKHQFPNRIQSIRVLRWHHQVFCVIYNVPGENRGK